MQKVSIIRTAVAVLASGWFFPVSCTTGLVVGTEIVSHNEAVNSESGTPPLKGSYMIAALGAGATSKFETFPYYRLANFRQEHPDARFLLPSSEGKFPVGTSGATVSFVVTKLPDTKQLVEVSLHDDTSTFFRYIATANDIRPMYSRQRYHGHMFTAIPYAFVAALLIHFLGIILRKRLQNTSSPAV